jgi:hypothetical protein
MKQLGLFLLAVVILVGAVGCGGKSEEEQTHDVFEFYLVGDYTLKEITITEVGITKTYLPPDISGTLILTHGNTYHISITYLGKTYDSSGTFVSSFKDNSIVFTETGSGATTFGTMYLGKTYKIYINETKDGAKRSLVFEK